MYQAYGGPYPYDDGGFYPDDHVSSYSHSDRYHTQSQLASGFIPDSYGTEGSERDEYGNWFDKTDEDDARGLELRRLPQAHLRTRTSRQSDSPAQGSITTPTAADSNTKNQRVVPASSRTGQHVGLTQDAFHEGEDMGHKKGREKGLEEGRKQGQEKGRKQGHIDGKKEGFREGEAAGFDRGYEEGFEAGRSEGYQDGGDHGYTSGFQKGRAAGKAESGCCIIL